MQGTCGMCSIVGCDNCPFRTDISTDFTGGNVTGMKLKSSHLLVVAGIVVVGFLVYKHMSK